VTKVKVRCQVHPNRVIGVVDMSRGWPGFQSRAGYRGRIARHLGGDSSFTNLKEWSGDVVEGWCRDCGARRPVKVADLLQARRGVVLA
jgi:hypothetical protein